MRLRTCLVGCLALSLTGCVSVFFDAGYSTWDTKYFQSPPVIVKRGTTYSLRWTYGTGGFSFEPKYQVRDGALWFSLAATSGSGGVAGETTEMEIKGEHAIAALKSGGAFWSEPDHTSVRLMEVEKNPTPVRTGRHE